MNGLLNTSGKYSFHDVDGTWQEARDACGNGTHLVTMETTEEWEVVKRLISQKVKKSGSFTHWYIGLRYEGRRWKWTEAGNPGVTVDIRDSRWQPHEPSSGNSARNRYPEACAEINSEYPQGTFGHFNNVKCDEKPSTSHPRGYICETILPCK